MEELTATEVDRRTDALLAEAEACFMGQGGVHRAAAAIAGRLTEAGIDDAIAGAIALGEHRFKQDLADVLRLIRAAARRGWRAAALLLAAAVSLEAGAAPSAPGEEPAPLRVGLIGLDTSHAVAFTDLINDAARPDHVPGGRVVAAFKGGSPEVPASATRIERFTAELTGKRGVELVDSIETLVARVDAVMLLSVDGRQHLAQARPVLAAGKRVFIDKPLAGSYRDARAIAQLSRETGTPFFSSSSLRFAPHVETLRGKVAGGRSIGAFTWGPAPTEPYLPDLFWYGIHSVEALYALMGPGCESVSRVHTAGADVVSCRWRDGRVGTVRGIRDGERSYGAVVFGSDTVASAAPGPPEPGPPRRSDYYGLVREIMTFFQTGVPPVAPEETLELIAFMEAADLSKARGGAPVALTEVTR